MTERGTKRLYDSYKCDHRQNCLREYYGNCSSYAEHNKQKLIQQQVDYSDDKSTSIFAYFLCVSFHLPLLLWFVVVNVFCLLLFVSEQIEHRIGKYKKWTLFFINFILSICRIELVIFYCAQNDCVCLYCFFNLFSEKKQILNSRFLITI